MKKLVVNLILFFTIISISSAVLAAGIGHATGIPPSASIEGVSGLLVCIQSGTELKTQGYDYPDLKDDPETVGWTTNSNYVSEYGTRKSKTYYHSATDMTSSGSNALWYIAANSGNNATKQIAVWSTIGGGISNSSWVTDSYRTSGGNLVNEANAAASFISGGFNVTDQTNYQTITVKQENGKLVVGPYNLNFNNVSYGSTDFSKVTGTYIVDKDGNKIKDVEVLGGSIYSNQDFYITYEPHDSSGNLISYAKLKVDFTYLA